jgi:hypothetical protein
MMLTAPPPRQRRPTMTRYRLATATGAFGLLLLIGCAARTAPEGTAITPPSPAYQRVSLLFPPFPDYLPHQGTLYVDPTALPAGPFLAYDKRGQLVASMYMIPIRELEAKKPFENLGTAPNLSPVRVQMYYHDAHPGIADPHYHIVLWYVPADQEPK